MSTYSELVYMVLDKVKGFSDDFIYTEDHIIFLLDKYRALLLKKEYSDVRKLISESNYQTLCLELIPVPAISGEPCEGGMYLRSKYKIPPLMTVGIPKVFTVDYFQGEITFVSRDRMRYVGHNKYLQNIIYCTLGPDRYLYLKSPNPQYLYLERVKFLGIFQDSREATELQCDCSNENLCDILDFNFPIEDELIAPLLELVTKEIVGAAYKPEDSENNASDDLANYADSISRNMKSNPAK